MTAPKPRQALQRKPFVPIWRAPADVACRGQSTLFYSVDGASPQSELARVKEALSLCGGCLHREECLEEAMAEEKSGGGRYGIRGGLTPEQRKVLQKSRTNKLNNPARMARRREVREAAA